ncbi:hypothetical protein GCM10009756_24310 [Pseudokineococcus marinus]
MLEEVTTAGRENLDAGHVRRYDGKEDADATGEVELLRRWGSGPDSVLLDVGAGTGQLALAAAPHCARVVAVDVSPVMLEVLTEKIAASGVDDVEVARAGFLTYEHTGAPADVVYSRYALHHLPDAWKAVALHRLRQAMRTGGLLRLWDVVYDTAPAGAEAMFEAWCATGAEGDLETEGAWTRAEHEEHVRDEHWTFTWLLEPMLTRAGFVVEAHEHWSPQSGMSHGPTGPLSPTRAAVLPPSRGGWLAGGQLFGELDAPQAGRGPVVGHPSRAVDQPHGDPGAAGASGSVILAPACGIGVGAQGIPGVEKGFFVLRQA